MVGLPLLCPSQDVPLNPDLPLVLDPRTVHSAAEGGGGNGIGRLSGLGVTADVIP